jgi:hypothetical protein
MSTLTAAQRDWVKEVFGVDSASYETAAAPGRGDAAAPPGDGGAASAPDAPAAAPAGGASDPAALDKAWNAALQAGDWTSAARTVNGFPAAERAKRLKALSDDQKVLLHGATIAAGIATSPAGSATLDAAFTHARKAGDWKQVGEILNAGKPAEMMALLTKLSGADVAALHKAACADAKVGPSSKVALATETLAHPTLGSAQETRAAALEKELSPDDQKKYHDLLHRTKSAKEKDYITKGLAAKHSVADLASFARKIAGKNAKWMQDNLSLTGASDGTGVKQQWHDSCGPTTFEAVQGELDPLYALKKHEDNAHLNAADDSNATKKNPKLAADQKAILKGGGGVAVDRNKTGGSGMWIAGALNKVSASTGLTYDLKKIGEGATLDEGVKALNDAAAAGEPLPISIGNGAKNYQHYVLVTASDPGPPRYYSIHDPWDGKTVIRSEDQLRRGKIDIAGCNDFESFDKPTAVKVK